MASVFVVLEFRNKVETLILSKEIDMPHAPFYDMVLREGTDEKSYQQVQVRQKVDYENMSVRGWIYFNIATSDYQIFMQYVTLDDDHDPSMHGIIYNLPRFGWSAERRNP